MAKIKIKAARLPVPNKLAMADQVIAKGTNNPNVPDNLTLLQDLGSKSSALKASAEAVAAARLASKLATRQLKADEKAWTVSMNNTASHTESATSGDAMKIQSAGFDVRNAPTPPQLPGQAVNFKVALNGMERHSTLTSGWPAGR